MTGYMNKQQKIKKVNASKAATRIGFRADGRSTHMTLDIMLAKLAKLEREGFR